MVHIDLILSVSLVGLYKVYINRLLLGSLNQKNT